MDLDKEIASVTMAGNANTSDTPTIWEFSPCAMSLWTRNRSVCLLNESARHLLNYTESDFLHCPSLWVERIHPQDQKEFCRSEEALRNGKSPVQSDYRFLPKNAPKHIWLREASVLNAKHENIPWQILSVYTDISDLKVNNAAAITENNIINTIRLLNHELMNCVQKVVMELEFVKLGLDGGNRSNELLSTVDAMNRSMLGLRDYLMSLFECRPTHDLDHFRCNSPSITKGVAPTRGQPAILSTRPIAPDSR